MMKAQLTRLFEYRSGKSHMKVAVSPVFTDTVSKESSKEQIEGENNTKIEMSIRKIMRVWSLVISISCHI